MTNPLPQRFYLSATTDRRAVITEVIFLPQDGVRVTIKFRISQHGRCAPPNVFGREGMRSNGYTSRRLA